MKKLVGILIVFSILSIFLNVWSGIIGRQITDYMTPTENGKAILLANLQLQRSLVSSSSAVSVGEGQFFAEAMERLDVVFHQLEKSPFIEKKELEQELSILKTIKKQLLLLRNKHEHAKEISRQDYLELVYQTEKLGKRLHERGKNYWGENYNIVEELIANFEKVNLGVKFFQGMTILIFLSLVFTFVRKKQLEKENKAQERLHSLLFSSLSEGVFLCSREGIIRSCNYSGSLILGLAPQELVGKRLVSFFNKPQFFDEQMKTYLRYQKIEDLVSKGDSYSGVYLCAEVDGKEKWFLINGQPILDDDETSSFSTILSMNDITESMQAKDTIRNQQMQLVESAKMQSIGEMASGIAHEINNPLTVISFSTERLSMKAKKNDSIQSEEVAKVTTKIRSTVERMAKIVHSLLALSRGDQMKMTKVNAQEIVNIAVDFGLPLLKQANVELDLSEVDGDLELECNAIQISQVILNLVKNSKDAIQDLPEKWIKIKTLDLGDSVRFEVIDSGGGIAPELSEKILMPFFTTKAIGSGTGLGLSISRKIMEVHQGVFDIDSSCKNTCFYFVLPKKQSERIIPEHLKDVA